MHSSTADKKKVTKMSAQPGRVFSVSWICTSCTYPVPQDAKYCPSCGRKFLRDV